ncbi:MAG: NAD-dependent deacylase [Succinimonas sp.]|nr:NAD-dependent deacylase [Succinimonas sp.]
MAEIRNIVILTGAGISQESGIPTFRSEDGLWEQHRVEDVATPEGYIRDPDLVHRFYNRLRKNLDNVKPNPAHEALARLEKEWRRGSVTVVTQNIDDLHERGGSKNVIHMHGELKSILCKECGAHTRWEQDSSEDAVCPVCGKKELRPDIVWFGEMPYFMEEIDRCLSRGSLFLSIGTSGVVYPAAGFVRTVNRLGYPSVEFNLTPSLQNSSFTYSVYGKAGVTVPDFVARLLESGSIDFLKKQS